MVCARVGLAVSTIHFLVSRIRLITHNISNEECRELLCGSVSDLGMNGFIYLRNFPCIGIRGRICCEKWTKKIVKKSNVMLGRCARHFWNVEDIHLVLKKTEKVAYTNSYHNKGSHE